MRFGHAPHPPRQDPQPQDRANHNASPQEQGSAIARRHGVLAPKMIVNRSQSWPASASRTIAPSIRGLETARARSTPASTSAARRPAPATTPDPSDRHVYEVSTAESGMAP